MTMTMTTATRATAIYWDLDHLAPARRTGSANHMLVPASALSRAIDHAAVQRALGSAATVDSLLAQALERAGVELIETCCCHGLASRAMDGFVQIAADDMALNANIGSVVLVSERSDVRPLASFVARAGRRFVQIRRAGVWAPAQRCTVREPELT